MSWRALRSHLSNILCHGHTLVAVKQCIAFLSMVYFRPFCAVHVRSLYTYPLDRYLTCRPWRRSNVGGRMFMWRLRPLCGISLTDSDGGTTFEGCGVTDSTAYYYPDEDTTQYLYETFPEVTEKDAPHHAVGFCVSSSNGSVLQLLTAPSRNRNEARLVWHGRQLRFLRCEQTMAAICCR